MFDNFTPDPDPADVEPTTDLAVDDATEATVEPDATPPVVAFLVALAKAHVAPGEETSRAVLAAAHDVVSELDQ